MEASGHRIVPAAQRPAIGDGVGSPEHGERAMGRDALCAVARVELDAGYAELDVSASIGLVAAEGAADAASRISCALSTRRYSAIQT